ncbi:MULTISPECIES: SUKH-3 domain-containing protein [unclassified Streptomyces]|uniref:SUKH-3 domain-containing protein n=1 Tax=unclassified Streptomyces TaxID=2593676 RepID=UPI002E2B6EC0|nr:SUKH-3 domain-containing protein [Streptomyces sp. NBC_00223]
MTDASNDSRSTALAEVLIGALEVEYEDFDLEEACASYVESGYEVTIWLRRFLENYAGITIRWPASRGTWVNELTTSIESALDAYPGNVRNYSRRLGQDVLPIGMAFATEERLLLAENGDVFLGGDAGLQWVSNGFEEALRALISNEWDKTFF